MPLIKFTNVFPGEMQAIEGLSCFALFTVVALSRCQTAHYSWNMLYLFMPWGL